MPINTDNKKIQELLTRGVEETIVRESFEEKLKSGKPLRVKFGIDPTGFDLHIGHAVPLRKLKQFQELGHQVILLIGDFTAMIGDPTGRKETRSMLTREQVEENMETYILQASKVLDFDTVEVRHNSEWYKETGIGFIMNLTSKITVPRVLDREDFKKRLAAGEDISMQELIYPLLQGYDSVALKADVEIGGSDQKFNLLMGRKVQRRYDQPEQDIMTVSLLEGTDGVRKMSKTYDNYIALLDPPEEMYGKTMSIPDSLLLKYFELATDVSLRDIEKYQKQLAAGDNPMDIKSILAWEITRLYHGERGASKGREHFGRVISSTQLPKTIPELHPSAYDIITVLVRAGFAASKTDARRLIDGGGVRVNDRTVDSYDYVTKKGDVAQKGKRFFVKVL
ncbi:MAG: tyrosine--tRNA ligase [Patescibacteria group bacterium]